MVGMWGMTSDLYHLREVTSIGQLQNNVKFVVLDEGVQVLYHVRVVQLLQVTTERETDRKRERGEYTWIQLWTLILCLVYS